MKVRFVLQGLLLTLAATSACAQWKYGKQPDEMRKITRTTALMKSSNSHQFSFPYQGGSKLSLVIWNDPARPANELREYVGLFISRGQFGCYVTEPCEFHLKIDDQEPAGLFAYVDDDPGVLWLTDGSSTRVLEALPTAKSMIIEVPIYQHGAKQFKFSTRPLRWPK